MRYILLFAFLTLSLQSCKSSKSKINTRKTPKTTRTTSTKTINKTADAVVKHAKTFEGVKYKYGGNTRRGMDCSGLVHEAFRANDISLPRTTSALSTSGDWIDLKEVEVGDLVFFATRKNSRKVNHVGIVTNTRTGYVEFIHASTSKGVIVSSLAERYWYFAFVQARRIL